MKEFNKGWWNCFCSYTEEMAGRDYDWEATAHAQLDGAGVAQKEIEYVLKEYCLGGKTEVMLKEYLQTVYPSLPMKKGKKK